MLRERRVGAIGKGEPDVEGKRARERVVWRRIIERRAV